jgi:hypothetical protein
MEMKSCTIIGYQDSMSQTFEPAYQQSIQRHKQPSYEKENCVHLVISFVNN